MNQSQRDQWVKDVLREVLTAMMHDPALREALVFKGAWILNLHLGESRHSMDIDAAAEPAWVQAMGSREQQEAFLKEHLPRAVSRHFERQDPVRFTLEDAKVQRKPRKDHPRGWDMLGIKLAVRDHKLAGDRSLPAVEIEVAAAESYGTDAVEECNFLGVPARVYSLHRIAGEKLRAYLTSLPEYRAKMHGGERAFRVKDLHDLARIVKHRPLEMTDFWAKATREFKMACQSRYVDCAGPDTFKQDWEQARQRYEQDQHLSAISFAEAEAALDQILAALSGMGVFPLAFPAPPATTQPGREADFQKS